MPNRKVTLLDRALGDLKAVKILLSNKDADDVLVDICAYHCQQCVEKVAKYLITLQGDFYANDHKTDMYLQDLKDDEVVSIIETIAARIDSWSTTIRYASSIKSSRKAVQEVLEICEKLVALAKLRTPKRSGVKRGNVKDYYGMELK